MEGINRAAAATGEVKVHTLTLLLVLWKKFTSVLLTLKLLVIMIDLVMGYTVKVLLYGLVKTT
jgi:hypothetical protein